MPIEAHHPATLARRSGLRVGIVLSRFNPAIGDGLLAARCARCAKRGVADDDISVVTVPGALETPLALQRLAQTGDFDALVALGAVIRGETYHFEIVANESAARRLERAARVRHSRSATASSPAKPTSRREARMDQKGDEAAQAALEMANLLRGDR